MERVCTTRLPTKDVANLSSAKATQNQTRKRVRLSECHSLMRGIEAAVRLRCAVLAMPYGDQALFLSSRTFASLGGFADIPLMEDVDLVHRAGAIGAIRILPEVVVTSGRRWESAGVLRMTLINLSCLVGFRLGIPTSRLATWRDRHSKVRELSSGAHRNELEPMPCIDPSGPRAIAER